jgi:hypothetical protein
LNNSRDPVPTADLLLKPSKIEADRAVLRVFMEHTGDPLRGITTAQVVANELFEHDGYAPRCTGTGLGWH